MKVKNQKLLWILPFLVFGLFFVASCGEEKSVALVESFREKADRYENQAKMKMIESAATIYTLENNERPKSLEDLVAKGYLNAADILDHNGNKLSFSTDALPLGSGDQVQETKRCGECGNLVDPGSQVGDRCPYCGVVWTTLVQEDGVNP